MKKLRLIYLLFVVLSVGAIGSLSSCKKDNPPSPEEINKALITSGVWKISTVTVDGVDRTSLFTGLTLQYTSGNYTTTNGGPVWPASGTWAFKDASAMSILRDGNLDVTVSTITETSLVLALVWTKTTLGTGRSGSIAGAHVFTFVK